MTKKHPEIRPLHRRSTIAALATALLTLAPGLAAADNVRPLSSAQIALFESDHLHGVGDKTALTYDFEHRGAGGDYSDHVTETIQAVHDNGSRDVAVAFLTGTHAIEFPMATSFKGNPLLMYFLEHDVAEMHQATQGASLYFRNRIREAFLVGAETHAVTITHDGKQEQATEITVTPFLKDPMIDRFPAFAEKRYHFVLSDAIPGTIYEISTTLPHTDASVGAFTDSVTYAGEQR
jgi:hypothetical protein